MSNDVNTNPFDEGPKREEKNATKTVEFDEKNYLNTRLGKNENKREISIRVILTRDIDGREKSTIPVLVHNLKLSESQNKEFKVSKNGFKSFICLDDPHVHSESAVGKCPLCARMDELFAEANEVKGDSQDQFKALCKEAYSYETKVAYIVRVIERGHEEDGVKFWRFNKHDDGTGIFDILLNNYMAYKENGEDIFDYHKGHDIKLILSKKVDNTKSGAKEKTGVMLIVDTKQTPLAESEEQIDAWVNDGKDWRDMYKTKSYDYLRLIADGETPIFNKSLGKFVPYSPGERTENETISHEEVTSSVPPSIQPETSTGKPEEDLPF